MQAGFNAGDGENYYSIEGAQTAAVVNFTLTSNVGIPGKWVFRVDGKSVEDVKCHHAGKSTYVVNAVNQIRSIKVIK